MLAKETETEKLKKEVQNVTKEKDSKIAKIKLLLGKITINLTGKM